MHRLAAATALTVLLIAAAPAHALVRLPAILSKAGAAARTSFWTAH